MAEGTNRRGSWLLLGLLVAALAAGCLRGSHSRQPPIHLNPNMDRQPKYRPQAASEFFYNGSTAQAPPRNTVARGELREDEEYFTGRSAWGFFVSNPEEPTSDLVARGQERFQIFCAPCHGRTGDGQSKLQERGRVRSADLTAERVRQMPDGRLYQIITHGTGLMPGYAFPLVPRDRWAIVAYLRQLQGQG